MWFSRQFALSDGTLFSNSNRTSWRSWKVDSGTVLLGSSCDCEKHQEHRKPRNNAVRAVLTFTNMPFYAHPACLPDNGWQNYRLNYAQNRQLATSTKRQTFLVP